MGALRQRLCTPDHRRRPDVSTRNSETKSACRRIVSSAHAISTLDEDGLTGGPAARDADRPEEGRLPGHAQRTGCANAVGPPPIANLPSERRRAWEGQALPRISTGRSVVGLFLNNISTNAARDESSADGQSWARIGIKNSQGITALIV
jgi:hypothetical protein